MAYAPHEERPSGGEAKAVIDLSHPAYIHYQAELQRLRAKAENNAWSLDEIDLTTDKQSFEAIAEERLPGFFFMASHRLNAEFQVARQLAPFMSAIPEADLDTQIMLSLQAYEEYKHTDGVRNFYRDVMNVADFDQMRVMADENMDPVSQTLYGGLNGYISRLAAEPSQRNLTAGFFAYHGLAEGVIAEVFSKFTYDAIDKYGDFPGFKYGHEKVRQDEARHVAFGMAYGRLQYQIDSAAAQTAIFEPALEFKSEVDFLLRLAEESGLENLTQDGYGRSPRQIYDAVIATLHLRLRRIDPELEREFLALTQDVDGAGSHQHDGQERN